MLVFWEEDSSYWKIGMAYALIGIGVGLAGTPASHSLTGSVPVRRAGMASGTADLQRDLGGAIMQSIFGALLTAGYASAFASAIGSSSDAAKVSPQRGVRAHEVVRRGRAASRSSTRSTPTRSPPPRSRPSCRATTGPTPRALVAILLGAVLVFFCFPRKEAEQQLLRDYAVEDAEPAGNPPHSAPEA